MVNLSRRLGAVIMPTNWAVAGLRDSVFALLNLSSGFRAFVRRGGVLPPPQYFAQCADRRGTRHGDRPDAAAARRFVRRRCPAARQFSRLSSMAGARHRLRSGRRPVRPRPRHPQRTRRALCCHQCSQCRPRDAAVAMRDQTFLDWAKRHRLGGVLVRPDHFIAERLTHNADSAALTRSPKRRARRQPRHRSSRRRA